MPLFELLCEECGETTEVLVLGASDQPRCGACGGARVRKLLSAHSSLSGERSARLPGSGDTSCCGSSPREAGCAGPGSCCGKGPF